MTSWKVEDNGDGTFDVFKDGRAVFNAAFDLEEAVDVVRRGGGSKYEFVQDDGYRRERSIYDYYD